MDDFLEKWKKDNKFRAKVKLLGYLLFVIFVSLYAVSVNGNMDNYALKNITISQNDKVEDEDDKYSISLFDKYDYAINIISNNNNYKYYGNRVDNKVTITKSIDDEEINYVYEDDKYYIQTDTGTYELVSRDEVYDVVKYNYISIDSINNYLSVAKKDGNKYLVYLKDVILGSESNDYFVIEVVNDDGKIEISIDYTQLVKEFNDDINKYEINILINEKE